VSEKLETDNQVDKFDNMVEAAGDIIENLDGCDIDYVARQVVEKILEMVRD
jgi:hypothetical protein